MTITPDTKDWTWVLRRPCPECGYEAAAVDVSTLPDTIRGHVETWKEILAGPDVGRRPDPQVWSALEYGCHVRDVHTVFVRRLRLMLTKDDPLFENWDQDATAVEDRYAEQDPTHVALQLDVAGRTLADDFAGVHGEQWHRTGRRSDGAVFTVEGFARYYLHDVVHHLHDVGRGVVRTDPDGDSGGPQAAA